MKVSNKTVDLLRLCGEYTPDGDNALDELALAVKPSFRTKVRDGIIGVNGYDFYNISYEDCFNGDWLLVKESVDMKRKHFSDIRIDTLQWTIEALTNRFIENVNSKTIKFINNGIDRLDGFEYVPFIAGLDVCIDKWQCTDLNVCFIGYTNIYVKHFRK